MAISQSRPLRPRRTSAGAWVLRLAFLAFSLGIALVVAEVALRRVTADGGPVRRVEGPPIAAYDPQLGWSLIPGARDRHTTAEFDVAVRINAQGFRADRTYSPAPPPGTRRIVAVGDSFTYGHGVEIEEAFPTLLERRLPRTEVVNLAVSGYGTDQQLLMLRRRGLAFRPDVVLLGFYVTNVFRNDDPAHGEYAKPYFRLGPGGRLELANVPAPPRERAAPASQGLAGRSRLWRFVADKLEYRGLGEVWDVSEAILAEMAATARQAGARFVVVLLPTEESVYGSSLERTLQAQTLRRAAAILPEGDGVVAVDPMPALLDEAASRPEVSLYFDQDGHLTAAGHRVVAAEIARALDRLPLAR